MAEGVCTGFEGLTERQRKVIRALKGLDAPADSAPTPRAPIPISKDGVGRIGSLAPLDRSLAGDEEVVEAITRWRRRFGRFFFTQFEATEERTRSWLERVVLPDDARILFLIKDDSGAPVGHLGVCHITRASAELDNYIRGRRGGDPKLMLFAGLSLIGWAYAALGVRHVTARVYADNHRTLALYDETGCFERGPVAPRPTTPNGSNDARPHETHTTRDADNAPGIVKMTLDTRRFLSLYPWMTDLAEHSSR
jgi:RimJ/RimL family protein N-acetyltransferase